MVLISIVVFQHKKTKNNDGSFWKHANTNFKRITYIKQIAATNHLQKTA